jgi:hypothetical protein
MAGADELSDPPKKPLAKRGKFSHPWHWAFPPWPGSEPGLFSALSIGVKGPFLTQYQSFSSNNFRFE